MAIYEYKCLRCDTIIQVNRGISEEDPGYKCDTCNSELKRVYSLGAITFNGSGFYSKDK